MNESTLVRHERNDEITIYVAYRKAKEISDTTIRNEMVTINNFIKYCFADVKVTHISAFKYTAMPKKSFDIDAELIRRQTFSSHEYNTFTNPLGSYTVQKNTKHLIQNKIFERQIIRIYSLFCANSGLRSGEIRQLK